MVTRRLGSLLVLASEGQAKGKRASKTRWLNSEANREFYAKGNVHPTKEAAEAFGAAQGEKSWRKKEKRNEVT
jgi:hypothetical protein